MAKFEVTPELANILKSSRVQNNITSKSIADHIGKSQSYVSRLEKADIKKIEEETLTDILEFIFQKSNHDLDAILEKIYSTMSLQLTDEEINRQLWWDNYDTVLRRIPIPSDLVDDIVSRMKTINLSVSDLCQRINANEGISPQVTNVDRYPFNKWQAYIKNHTIDFCFIKVKISEEKINRILNKEITSSNYISLLAISYYLHKIEKYGSQVVIPSDESDNFYIIARDYLSKYKFFSISEKNRLSKLAQNVEEKDHLMSSFDRENQALVNTILSGYKVFSEIDLQRSNRVLAQLSENMKWDLMFMMSLGNINFSELKDISFSNKKNILHEIRNIIKKYKDLPEEQRTLNDYDF